MLGMEHKIANKYTIEKKIGEGKFGNVYKGFRLKKGDPVAIKMEETASVFKVLKRETSILKYLYDHGCRNIPLVFWFGPYIDKTCLIMSYYDSSLHTIAINKPLSIDKINVIMLKCISILQSIHKLLVLHRDIKPHNIMFREGELYLIDFGLATFCVDDSGDHLPNVIGADSLIGSPNYISHHVESGETPARRDDLISLGYIFIFLHDKRLPWENSNIDIEMMERRRERTDKKQWPNLEDICNKISANLFDYMKYCYHLKYDDAPNYDALAYPFFTPDR